MTKKSSDKSYHRYHIETKKTAHLIPPPSNFKVHVKKLKLAKLLLKELLQYRGNLNVVLSRPCVYGVFSGPIGGFAPIERLCVGCLRCTTQYPDMVTITRNPERLTQGDSYFLPLYIETVNYEAETGRIPIHGAGYRGKFGGSGWDSMWTDMSEIVRPTRDGIHGREYISTEIDIGAKRPYVELDSKDEPVGNALPTLSLPIPILFDAPPEKIINETIANIWNESAHLIHTLSVLPFTTILKYQLKGAHLIPLVSLKDERALNQLTEEFVAFELEDWDEKAFRILQQQFPNKLLILRTNYGDDLRSRFEQGVRNFHLTANYHGRGKNDRFILELIREAHQTFVDLDLRDEITLLGSGGIIAAEHLPKAILCGLDGVFLDTPLFVALQAQFGGPCIERNESHFIFPQNITLEWGKQRIKNLTASWREQLLEILGAMGLREVRRMRGELGRVLFQKDLENEAFAGIDGYEERR